MISFQTLLHEIEKHTNLAKSVDNEQQMRDQFIAIRTICDLALAEQSSNTSVTKANYSEQIINQPLQLNSTTPSLSSTQPLKEDDGANGQSLFDF